MRDVNTTVPQGYSSQHLYQGLQTGLLVSGCCKPAILSLEDGPGGSEPIEALARWPLWRCWSSQQDPPPVE